MPVLKNSRWERYCQLCTEGKSKDQAYTGAGYNPNRHNAARLSTNEHIIARIKELQGATADQIADVRDLARKHTAVAVETLSAIMIDDTAPTSARVSRSIRSLHSGSGIERGCRR